MKGRIFDIKRLSVHDGPGIRTTIFLKGCSLHCLWCHNPESISPTPEIAFKEKKCVGCRKCAEVCPENAHSFRNGVHIFAHNKCTACGKCVEACLVDALEYYGREISVKDTVEAILEDKTFYIQSGGGCTVSGGEPLLQAGFCAEIFKILHHKNIHCAVDTSGAVKWKCFETVLPHTDMFLYDVKHTDDTLHRRHVGRSNRQILNNLKRLSTYDVPIEIRIPIIPGFNNDNRSLDNIGELLETLQNITGVRILPYHHAHSKYKIIGYPDTMPEEPVPTTEQIQLIADRLMKFELNVILP